MIREKGAPGTDRVRVRIMGMTFVSRAGFPKL